MAAALPGPAHEDAPGDKHVGRRRLHFVWRESYDSVAAAQEKKKMKAN